MVTFWHRLKNFFWCDHSWEWVKNVEDRNLRAGYRHWSSVYHCSKCRKNRTLELTDDPGPP